MIQVPEKLLQCWERDAFNQGVPVSELSEFLRHREMMWREKTYKKPKSKTLLEMLDEMEPVARVLYNSRIDFMLLHDFKNKKSEIFIEKREHWWQHLRDAMQKFRISKETLAAHGIDWGECRRFYFSAV